VDVVDKQHIDVSVSVFEIIRCSVMNCFDEFVCKILCRDADDT